MVQTILSINCGSSSVKFARYRFGGESGSEALNYAGSVERIGLPGARLRVTNGEGKPLTDQRIEARDHAAALDAALDWLERRPDGQAPDAIGHRVVHGGADYSQPARIGDQTLATLRRLAPLAPLHLPVEIAAIEALRRRYPTTPQVACFDTAFHHTMPAVAQMYGLAQEWRDRGVRRYGFHGLSYEYIMSEIAAAFAPRAVPERIIIAHLGNGASMVAVRAGRSIETTMGFTPTGGLVMSARSGDLDPGVLLYLLESLGLPPGRLRDAVEKTAGLLGVSGTSGDMRDLLARAAQDPHAEAAVALFCYTAKKYLGALVAALGGLDLVVFTGGIGEHAAEVRRRICAGLDFLRLRLDPAANDAHDVHDVHARTISSGDSAVAVQVIPTNEDLMIARHTAHTLGQP